MFVDACIEQVHEEEGEAEVDGREADEPTPFPVAKRLDGLDGAQDQFDG